MLQGINETIQPWLSNMLPTRQLEGVNTAIAEGTRYLTPFQGEQGAYGGLASLAQGLTGRGEQGGLIRSAPYARSFAGEEGTFAFPIERRIETIGAGFPLTGERRRSIGRFAEQARERFGGISERIERHERRREFFEHQLDKILGPDRLLMFESHPGTKAVIVTGTSNYGAKYTVRIVAPHQHYHQQREALRFGEHGSVGDNVIYVEANVEGLVPEKQFPQDRAETLLHAIEYAIAEFYKHYHGEVPYRAEWVVSIPQLGIERQLQNDVQLIEFLVRELGIQYV